MLASTRRARLVRLARTRLVRLRRVEPLVGGQQLQHQPDIIPLGKANGTWSVEKMDSVRILEFVLLFQ